MMLHPEGQIYASIPRTSLRVYQICQPHPTGLYPLDGPSFRRPTQAELACMGGKRTFTACARAPTLEARAMLLMHFIVPPFG